MKDLSTADWMHTQAADCWISIGNLARAGAELGEISPASREHPDVLKVRWNSCAQAHEWDVCLDIATTLTQIAPERPFGWIHLALSLRRLGKFRAAIRVLRDAIKQFGETPTLLLSLACCHARLRSLSQAAKCLKRAFDLAEDQQARDRLLIRAFDEPDLEPVWQGDRGSLDGLP